MQATIEDRRVGYESYGQGHGPALLLIHGFPLDRTMYAAQGEGLADIARVLAFDVPGVGRSEPTTLSMESMADCAARLLDALRIERAVVGGVSMGGYISLAFARRHPDRLRGLILANTKPAADTSEARAGRRAMADLAIEEGADAVAEKLIPKILGETARRKNRRLVERVRDMIEAVRPDTIAALLDAMAERPDSTPELASIRVPTLVLHSDQDELIPAADARAYASQIPGAQYVEIAGAGHLANLEAPEEFNRAVREFFQGLK